MDTRKLLTSSAKPSKKTLNPPVVSKQWIINTSCLGETNYQKFGEHKARRQDMKNAQVEENAPTDVH